jgi:hypothetical protein
MQPPSTSPAPNRTTNTLLAAIAFLISRSPLRRRSKLSHAQLTEKTPALLCFCHPGDHLPVDLLQECRTRPGSARTKNDFGPKTLRRGLPWPPLY